MNITKRAAKAALGIETDAELARFFHDAPTKQAANQWPDDEPLPDARQWELIARRPDLFGQASGATAEQAA